MFEGEFGVWGGGADADVAATIYSYRRSLVACPQIKSGTGLLWTNPHKAICIVPSNLRTGIIAWAPEHDSSDISVWCQNMHSRIGTTLNCKFISYSVCTNGSSAARHDVQLSVWTRRPNPHIVCGVVIHKPTRLDRKTAREGGGGGGAVGDKIRRRELSCRRVVLGGAQEVVGDEVHAKCRGGDDIAQASVARREERSEVMAK